MVVAGEASPLDGPLRNVAGFPTEKALSARVMALPKQVNGKYMSEGTVVSPCVEPGKVIKLSLDHGRWKLLSLKDNFSVVDSEGQPYGGGIYVKETMNIVGRGHRMVMFDADDKPICLAAQDPSAINKKYEIFGLKPLVVETTTTTTTREEGGGDAAPKEKYEDGDGNVTEFYPWFRVRDIDDNHLDYRSLLVWNGNNYQPMMKIRPAKRLPDEPIGDLFPPLKNDNLVTDAKDATTVYATMCKRPGPNIVQPGRIAGWEMTLAPGVDPMVMIMLGTILDDMVGWFA